jgi:DNA invertase Pin-like site-specific DNA recombinase
MQSIGYCRVSTEEQVRGGVSLDAQEARLRSYCAGAGLTLVEVIRDEGVSASKPLSSRPGGAALLRMVARRQVRHVVVVTLDRAFRNTIDCLTTVQAWDLAHVALHLVDHGGQSINTKTAVGRMFLTMLAGFAEMERRLTAERITAALRHKKGQGQVYGPIPYGFDRAGNRLVPNGAEQKVIRQMRRWRQAGRTLAWIADTLTRRGIPAKRRGEWNAYGVSYILKNTLHQEVA